MLWKKILFISIGIRNSPILCTLLHPIDKASSTKLIHPIDTTSSTAFPSFSWMIGTVKRMKILFMSQRMNADYLAMFSRTKWIKLVMKWCSIWAISMQLMTANTIFDKSRFYAERYSCYYLLLDTRFRY